MNKIEYQEYLKSDVWKIKRNELLKQGKCFICNNQTNLMIHHLSYLNVGNEDLNADLVVLCQFCHHKIHFTRKGRKVSLSEKYVPTPLRRFFRRLAKFKKIRRLKNVRSLREAKEIIKTFSNYL